MRNPDDPSLIGGLLYRFFYCPVKRLKTNKDDFLLYCLLRTIRGGPFKGLRYVGDSPSPQIAPFLLGMNEREIWPFVERLIHGQHDVFVNVGAAEGYYAVGMARFSNIPRVISFESSRLGRVLTRLMARKNGVPGKIDVRGNCDPEALSNALAGAKNPCLIVDVEGYERLLIDPSIVPALKTATMLIELHEHEFPVGKLLQQRFETTHAIEEARTEVRTQDELPKNVWPASMVYSRQRLFDLGCEHRDGPMRWWLMTPRAYSK